MKKTLFCLVLLVMTHPLLARESPLAMGFQAGFATTGSIVDMELGSLSLSLGFAIPLGYSQIAHTFDADPQATPYGIYTLTSDVTIVIPFSENLILKAGIGSIALTDFGPRITAVVGPVCKAEYWIWESNTALFISVLIPTKRFELMRHEYGPTTRKIYTVPGLAEEWLFTSSIGLLYGY